MICFKRFNSQFNNSFLNFDIVSFYLCAMSIGVYTELLQHYRIIEDETLSCVTMVSGLLSFVDEHAVRSYIVACTVAAKAENQSMTSLQLQGRRGINTAHLDSY